jgi:Putative auto-transporter adhesin, head GIN domain
LQYQIATVRFQKIIKEMKKTIAKLVFLYLLFAHGNVNAQLFGKGKILIREFDIIDFTKLSIEDFDGSIEVEIGKPYAITVTIDENLEPRLLVSKKENTLTIKLEGNYNGKLYLEKTHIKIKVSMPTATDIFHRGNTVLHVAGVSGRYFSIENKGNGDAKFEGEAEKLEIKKTGNGNVNASKIVTKMAKVNASGNGNVTVNASISLMAHGVGNGNIIQVGKGKIDPMSGVVGNGEVKMN